MIKIEAEAIITEYRALLKTRTIAVLHFQMAIQVQLAQSFERGRAT